MVICSLLTIWYTIRYGLLELLDGVVLTGHDLYYTGEVHSHDELGDHWEMQCKRCGLIAGTDIAPER